MYEIKIETLGKNLDSAGAYLQNAAGKIDPGGLQSYVIMKNDDGESAQGLGRVNINTNANLLRSCFSGGNGKRPVENVRCPRTGSGKIDERRIV